MMIKYVMQTAHVVLGLALVLAGFDALLYMVPLLFSWKWRS